METEAAAVPDDYAAAREAAARRHFEEGAALADVLMAGHETFEAIREAFEEKYGYVMVRRQFERVLEGMTEKGLLRKTRRGWRYAVEPAKTTKR